MCCTLAGYASSALHAIIALYQAPTMHGMSKKVGAQRLVSE